MTPLYSAIIILALLPLGASASASGDIADVETQPTSASETSADASPDEERMVCTRTRQTGSNRVTRLCRTVEDAHAERKAAEESMRRKRAQPSRDELFRL